ncbi:MAG: response regulator transcription factor [Actinobacteria bacterium]|nr:MAG: response regulator transcription factor [Actinomycetota bacterium]
MTGAKVRVLLAEEQSLFREAMRIALESQDDIEVVAEAKDGLLSVTEAERSRPDVAFLDAGLPNCDGVRAAAMIRERVPECKTIILAAEDDLKTLIDGLEAGATGFLSKDSPLAELIEAARLVHQGETIVPRRMLGGLLARLIRRKREQDHAIRRMGRLTRREREILVLLSRGADNHIIARELVISPETARTHIQKVLGKLGVHSRLEAAAFVLQNGITDELVEAGIE